MNGVEKVLAQVDGSPSAVAQRLHTEDRPCSRQLVQYWMKQGYVPGSWAPTVQQKFQVPLHELNPIVYPKPGRPRCLTKIMTQSIGRNPFFA